MLPILALSSCFIFVALLLRMDRRQYPDASWALWLPTVLILLAASKPLAQWFGVYGTSMESGSPLDRTAQLALFFTALIVLFHRRFDWEGALRNNGWLLLLVGFELVSVCWSDVPFVSFKRWTRECVTIITAFIILTETEPDQALLSTFRRTIYILIPFSAVLIKYYPKYGVQFGRWNGQCMWIGVTVQKNCLGLVCLFAGFILVWTLIRRWKGSDVPVVKGQTYVELFLLLIIMWLLRGPGGSYSATAIGALLIGLVALAGLLWLQKHPLRLSAGLIYSAVIVIIVVGTLLPFDQESILASFTSIFGRNSTFTGRTDIWAKLVPYVFKNPVLGKGVGGFWTTKTVAETMGFNEAHNGYLDILLNNGFTGLLLFAGFFLSYCRKAQKELAFDYDLGALWIGLLLILMIQNITESTVYLLSCFSGVVLVAIKVCPMRMRPLTSRDSLSIWQPCSSRRGCNLCSFHEATKSLSPPSRM